MKIDILFVIDRSSSILPVINELNSSINEMINTIKHHYELKKLEKFLSILRFPAADDSLFTVKGQPVDELDKDFAVELEAKGHTDPSPALKAALDFCIPRYESWVKQREDCCRPIIFYLTDGRPNAGAKRADMYVDPDKQRKIEEVYAGVAQEIKKYENNDKLYFVGCGIGDDKNGADIDKIKELTDYSSHVIDLTEYNIVEAIKVFFGEFIFEMTSTVSDGDAVNQFFLSMPERINNYFTD